ncbi:MAG: 6-bladed beta-propeller [Candidatus Aminicenantes bacterium]|nr:6-bladed beta-propeller [Candidatus Aminicenantes bacterium]NIM79172.1 6-bladed beta-propeller [Candidatus Aminicenantes bacterium]NIN18457.1 6-bladed beta-propeller [Candidatus Aminicenantes bacterium]NIN42345.1 6-bladed beta-propeller [Candidatus Aminicenantes bacterium]NIN85111.1 6-bladed beta-propeller [Candidatus Aminicenantes bacterium]
MKRTIVIIMFFLGTALVFSKTVVPLPELTGDPQTITVDKERIYITNTPEILIYSVKDYKFLTKFGKKGEGPGEFMFIGPWNMHITVLPKELLVVSQSKISYFTKEGKFLRMLKIDPMVRTFFRVKPLGDGYIGVTAEHEGKGAFKFWYYIYDSQFRKQKKLSVVFNRGTDGKITPITQSPILSKYEICDNKIFLSESENSKGIIDVYDNQCNKLYAIEQDYEKIEFTKEDEKAYLKRFVTQGEKENYERVKHRYVYPKYFPAWQNFVIDNNKIYIQTFKRNKEDTANEFYILDLKGKLIKKVWVPVEEFFDFAPHPYTIKDNKIYQLVENLETEQFDLHISKIEE